MPGKVKVKIISGRNLPVMDRSSDTTDAYVEIKLGSTTYKTDVCRKSLHPQWNSEWYRFEVDDSELQDEPLQIRLMDHDTYSANDAIGKVYLDLNPLLLSTSTPLIKYIDGNINHERPTNSVMSGWIPVYDTMHGIRGEVNVIVKVELFSDFNRFRQSSCGIQFFCSRTVPHGFFAQTIHGFVEELVVNDDPEYQWIDKIRTPRASNEARQTLFFKLSGELQRKIGVKALDLGANAVIGYCQCFDLEGESGIVARGIGTAVTLVKLLDQPQMAINEILNEDNALEYLKFLGSNNFFIHTNRDCNPQSWFVNPLDLNTSRNKQLAKHLSNLHNMPNLRTSKSNPSLTQSNPSLKSLLKQEDMRGTPRTGISQKIKNLKYSSQNILSKKMTALKAKLGDSGIDEESGDDKTTKGKGVMAELLARSVLHAQDSLGSILEYEHSLEAKSDESLDSDAQFQNNSEFNTSIGQFSNISSYETSSSSDDDDDDDDNLSDSKTSIDFETVSNIVKNVEILENRRRSQKLSKQISLPAIPYSEYDVENDIDFINEPKLDEDKLLTAPIAQIDSYSSIEDADTESASPPETIISPIIAQNSGPKPGLVKTAMQTILLEKVNSMGIYTPPVSPTYFDNEKTFFHTTSPTSSIYSTPTPDLLLTLDAERSPTIGSLNDTVLGLPFISITDLNYKRQNSNPFFSNKKHAKIPICFSDSELNRQSQENIDRNKYEFVKLLSKTSGSLLTPPERRSSEVSRKRFNFLKPYRRKSQSDLKKSRSINDMQNRKNKLNKSNENVKSRSISSFFRKSRNKSKNPSLLGTALGNVVVETVQDILATSSSDNAGPINEQIIKSDSNPSSNNMHASSSLSPRINNSTVIEVPTTNNEQGHQRTESIGAKPTQSPAKLNSVPCIHRRSSDSDLSITPKGNSLTGSDRSGGGHLMKTNILLRPTVPQDNFDMLEYPFLTMSKYPANFILHLGGAVSARSVKLLERISNLEEPESRDIWWSEIRMEIRSHARALNCNAVLGYIETTTICEEVCVLSASGTAAVIGFQYPGEISDSLSALPIISRNLLVNKDLPDIDKDKFLQKPLENKTPKYLSESPELDNTIHNQSTCMICHLPYNTNNVPIRATTLKCGICRTGKVPDILIATIETPDSIPVMGRGCFIQCYVCRQLRDLRGELNAKEISDGLPFLEYELHRLLINKIKIKGMNAIFGLKISISIGEKMLVGVATGTAVFLTPLPPPVLPKLISDRSSDEKKLSELQKRLQDIMAQNREIYQIKIDENMGNRVLSDNDDSEDDQISIDLSFGNKDCCVLEVDDPEDAEVLNLIIEARPPDGFHVVNTEFVPGLEDMEIVKNLQMFTQIYRAKIHSITNFDSHFKRLLQSIYFKLRRMVPCALCNLQFRIDLPEPDEIQLCVLGMALGLGEVTKSKIKRKNTVKKNDDDLIFNLEEDENIIQMQSQLNKQRQRSPLRNRGQIIKQRHMPYKERHGVDITPLTYIPGGKIERYLGNLNFFFIRETTSIREEGGLSGFIHSFITEVLAIVRAHITALGGNAMVAYFLTECVLNYNLHKNQGQCLINVGGDVVHVSYYNEDVN